MNSVCVRGFRREARKLLPLSLWLSILSAATFGGAAHAALITVDTKSDTVGQADDCSLREAVEAANTNSPIDGCPAGDDQGEFSGDVIRFAEELAGETITLTQGALDIGLGQGGETLPSLAIEGPATGEAGDIIIDGDGQDRVFDVSSDALLSNFFISNLTVTGGLVETGEVPAEGGGIRVVPAVSLVLDSVRVTGNAVDAEFAPARGGGIFAGGPLTIRFSTISGNSATSDTSSVEGGGLHYAPSFPTGVPGQILATEISDNDAVSVNGNALGGGIFLRAAFNSSGVEDVVRIGNSTISGNDASANGVESSALGGGLYGERLGLTVSLNNATIADNYAGTATGASEAGGGFAVADAAFELVNTLVADNLAGDGSSDCAVAPFDESATIASLGFNLIGDGNGCPLMAMAGDQVGGAGDMGSIDALLGALGDNGGPTRTHALLPGSPAIDAANPQGAETGCPETDQRGEPRPRDGDNSGTAECDIGAVEAAAVNQPPTVVQEIADQVLNPGDQITIDLSLVFEDPEGQPLTFTAESSNPEVATASVEEAILTVAAVSVGATTIVVTATDSMAAARRIEIPIAESNASLAPSSGGGCAVVSPGRAAPDPLLWLLVFVALFRLWRPGPIWTVVIAAMGQGGDCGSEARKS
ncbi:choice-of-anchor Q domain-containing protein [Salinisphaera sp. P385]|uniref:Choice-of-anchor Q domain-containing protein n=1 Tax=Spectribacter acetivorans TaxID=3075603 RepID=A0ABU3B9V1_9GAMM|nr:choice-of-anchor Q domain-containing protein [Salinisphaera sp. P385]MDT0618800.1 choice-of-anchor Q domain-containing protein [Salinisphaera sp. P385]